jgi:serpin B
MKRILPLFCIVVLSAGSVHADIDGPATVGTIVNASNAFGFDIFAQLRKEKPGKNVFISPYSISTCLAMVLGGAGGTTRTAMAKTLLLEGLSPSGIDGACAGLREEIKTPDPQVSLETANSLWMMKGLKPKTDFLYRSRVHFGATVQELDFNNPRARSRINSWVSDATHGKIDSIVDHLDARADALLLLNAVYFKGTWTKVFHGEVTRNAPFVPDTGGPKSVPMMHNGGRFEYFENEMLQAIRLPYGSGRLGMYIFLPRSGVPLRRLESDLNDTTWKKWTQQLQFSEGSIALPRFKLAYEANLNATLKALGMRIAFDPGAADFTGIGSAPDGRFFISAVEHKTFIDVNELGTEAAAVTGVMVGATSAPLNPFRMIVDRPFLYAIADRPTGAILFLGAMEDPTQG